MTAGKEEGIAVYLLPCPLNIHDHMLVPEVNVGNDRDDGTEERRDQKT